MECSQNDGSETQYYVVIFDRLQGRSGALEQALELRIRGPLTRNLLECTALVALTPPAPCQPTPNPDEEQEHQNVPPSTGNALIE